MLQAAPSKTIRASCSRTRSTVACSIRPAVNGAASGSVERLSRRDAALLGVGALVAPVILPGSSQAVGFKKELKKRKLSDEDFNGTTSDGLKFYDQEEGKGSVVELGDTVTVHFDCLYKGVDAVSSRYARTLGGNRTIAEPYEFVAGQQVSAFSAKISGDSAGGLFAGGSGPKPPQALSQAVVGMRQGGKRLVRVNKPELGYPAGNQEIPKGGDFELRVEVLAVSKRAA